MQLMPGNGGDSDLSKLLTVAALGAGAYYGFGGLAGAGETAGVETLVTDIGGGVTALASPVATGAPLASPVLSSAVPGSIASLAAPAAVTTLMPVASAGVATSILKGVKDAAPLAATVAATGALTPRMPGFPDIPALPSRADTAVSEARRKQMELDKLRRGRAASILTGSRGIEGGLGSVSRPAARAAQLLGD